MIRQLLRFVWDEKIYILLLPVAMLFATIWHEASHALAAMLQGATVTELSVLPSRSAFGYFRFGYTSYIWREPLYSERLISLAPLFTCTLLALSVPLYLHRVKPNFLAKLVLIFYFFLPLADVSMQLSGLFYQKAESDHFKALQGLEAPVAFVALVYFSLFWWIGRRLFRVVYQDALDARAFAVGYLFLLGASWIIR